MSRLRKKRSAEERVAVENSTPRRWPVLWPYVVLAILAFAIYAGSLSNGFVVDDTSQLVGNPLVTNYRLTGKAFTQDIWAFVDREAKTQSNYYRPLQIVLYMLLYQAVGPSALWFHLLMAILNVVNVLLVFHLGEYFLRSTPQPRLAALFAAALFAVHPIHTEAVAWIAVLPDMLMTILALTTLILFIRQNASPRGKQLFPYAILFFAAMLTKETSAGILPILVAYEWLYLGRSIREVLRNWRLYMLLSAVFAIYLAMRVHALGALAPTQNGYYKLHGKDLLLSMINLMGKYLWNLVVPAELNYFHVFKATRSVTPWVVLSLIAIATLVAAALLLRRKIPLISLGVAIIFIPLLPVMNINGVGSNVFTERYLYLPSVGFVWIAALAWEWLRERAEPLAWIAAAGIVIAGSYAVITRVADWHDDVTLYRATARLNPESAGVHMIFGAVLAVNGRVDEGLVESRKAVELAHEAPLYMNLGKILDMTGRTQEAIDAQEQAVKLQSDYAPALNELGLLRMKTKEYAKAVDCFQRAVRADPTYARAEMNLGIAYNALEDWSDAAAALRQGLKISFGEPYLYLAHYHLGIALRQLKSYDEAAAEFAKAYELDPGFAAAKQELDRIRGGAR